MKKLFYGLGAIAAVATPVVAVVSCGSNSTESTNPNFSAVTDAATLKTNVLEGFRAFRAKIAQAPIGQPFTFVEKQDKLTTNDAFYIPLSPEIEGTKLTQDHEDALAAIFDPHASKDEADSLASIFGDSSKVTTITTYKVKISNYAALDGDTVAPVLVDKDSTTGDEITLSVHFPTMKAYDGEAQGSKRLVAYAGLAAIGTNTTTQKFYERHVKTSDLLTHHYDLPTDLKITIKTEAARNEILAKLDEVVNAIKTTFNVTK